MPIEPEVTTILAQIQAGDRQAADQLLPLVYDELRKLASARMMQENPGQTLQATALVHQAYLRLVGDSQADPKWDNRGHFFAAAAEAMRRILVEQARRKQRVRHGGAQVRVDLEQVTAIWHSMNPDEVNRILAVHEALSQLELAAPRKAQLVKLRFFAGMTMDESASALGISLVTAKKDWAMAKVWLYRKLKED